MSFREEFIKDNPDKEIKILDYIANSGYGCHKAKCTWTPNCTVEDLVNYADDSTSNYGGRLENIMRNKDGTISGTVIVYFD